MREDQILHVLPRGVRGLLTGKRLKYEYLQEIRLRTGKPLLLIYQGREMMLHNQRRICGRRWNISAITLFMPMSRK